VFNQAWVERQLGELRPSFYAEALRSWHDSADSDSSYLLRGQALEEAEAWAEGKQLSGEDQQFLQASRAYEKAENEKKLAAERQRNQLLAEANQSMEKAKADAEQQSRLLAEAKTAADQQNHLLTRAKNKAFQFASIAAMFSVIILSSSSYWAIITRQETQLKAIYQQLLANSENLRSMRQAVDQSRLFQPLFKAVIGKDQAEKDKDQAEKDKDQAEKDKDQAEKDKDQAEKDKDQAEKDKDQAEKDKDQAEKNVALSRQLTDQELAGSSAERGFRTQQTQGLLYAYRVVLDNQNLLAKAQEELSRDNQFKFTAFNAISVLQTSLATIHETYLETNSVNQVAFSPDENYIATVGGDGTAHLWDRQGKELSSIVGVTSLVSDPQLDRIAVISGDGSVRLLTWDQMAQFQTEVLRPRETGRLTQQSEVYTHEGGTKTFAARYPLEGKAGQTIEVSLESQAFDAYVYLLDGQGKVLTQDDDGGSSNNSQLVYQLPADGTYQIVATSFEEGTIGDYGIEVRVDRTSIGLPGSGGGVSQVAFSPDGQYIATVSNDGTARLWDRQGQALSSMAGVASITTSPTGLALTSTSSQVRLLTWDQMAQFQTEVLRPRETGSLTQQSEVYPDDSKKFAARYPLDGKAGEIIEVSLESQAFDTYVYLLDGQGKVLAQSDNDGSSNNSRLVYQLPTDGDYQIVATSYEEGTTGDYGIEVRVDRTSIGLAGHEGGVKQVEFSSDGQYIATVSNDGTARLWDHQGRPVDGHGKPVNPEQQLVLGGKENSVSQVAFSPNEKYIATAGDNGALLLNFDRNLPRNLTRSSVNHVTFSFDGKYIATIDDKQIARLWDRQGTPIEILGGDGVSQVTFSPDGHSIVMERTDGIVLRELPLPERIEDKVWQVQSSPDRQYIATIDDKQIARLWDRHGKELNTIARVASLVSDPQLDRIALISGNSFVRLLTWEQMAQFKTEVLRPRETGSLTQQSGVYPDESKKFAARYPLEGQAGEIIEVSLESQAFDTYVYLLDGQGKVLDQNDDDGSSSNSQLVYQLPTDGTYQIVATSYEEGKTGDYEIEVRVDRTSIGLAGGVNQVEFSPNGQYIATVSNDGTARLWNRQGQALSSMARVASLVSDPQLDRIALISGNSFVRLLTWEQMAQFKTEVLRPRETDTLTIQSELYTNHFGAKTYAKRYPLEERKAGEIIEVSLESQAFDTYVYLLDGQGKVLDQNDDGGSSNNSRLVYQLPTDGDYQIVATSYEEGTTGDYGIEVRVDRTSIGLAGSGSGVSQVVFNPDGSTIATVGDDNTVRLWDRQARPVNGQDNPVSPEQQLVLGGKENPISVSQIVFSPNGQYIATADYAGIVSLWDRQGRPVDGQGNPVSPEQQLVLGGKENPISVSQIVFSPNGQYIATADYAGIVSLWDRQGNPVKDPVDPKQQLRLIGQRGQVSQILFSPDGKSIATVGLDDQTIRIWALPVGRQIAEYSGTGVLSPDFSKVTVLDPSYGPRVWPIYTYDHLHDLLRASCQRLRPYINSTITNPEEQRSLLRWCSTGE
jgi:WD40 repeat protein